MRFSASIVVLSLIDASISQAALGPSLHESPFFIQLRSRTTFGLCLERLSPPPFYVATQKKCREYLRCQGNYRFSRGCARFHLQRLLYRFLTVATSILREFRLIETDVSPVRPFTRASHVRFRFEIGLCRFRAMQRNRMIFLEMQTCKFAGASLTSFCYKTRTLDDAMIEIHTARGSVSRSFRDGDIGQG